MALAIMQPYFFPYLGYFQMVKAADKFVFYDDVNYIKGGWINRNRIMQNGNPNYLTIPLIEPSQNKKINEIEINYRSNFIQKKIKTIQYNYKRAPFYIPIMNILEEVFAHQTVTIAKLASSSVIKVSEYLDMETEFYFSSELTFGHQITDKADRLIEITKGFNNECYINAEGGRKLYSKEYFKSKDINLFFIESSLPPYVNSSKEFIPGLSIIDTLMHNSVNQVKEMLTDYKLS